MDQRTMASIRTYQLILGMALVIGTFAVARQQTLGVLVGALVMTGNLWAMERMVRAAVEGARTGAGYGKGTLFFLGTKFLAVVALLTLAVGVFGLSAGAVALGMLTLFGGICFGAIHARWTTPRVAVKG